MTDKEVYEYINSIEKWCQICGRPYNLHRHHIRYGACGRKTYIGNIIVLCDECHRMVHKDKKYWMPKVIELDEEIRKKYGDSEDENND